MPYITEEKRRLLIAVENLKNTIISPDNFGPRDKGGALNYLFTVLMKGILNNDKRYATAEQLIGACECAKLELYRREIAPYEDEKIKENGDV